MTLNGIPDSTAAAEGHGYWPVRVLDYSGQVARVFMAKTAQEEAAISEMLEKRLRAALDNALYDHQLSDCYLDTSELASVAVQEVADFFRQPVTFGDPLRRPGGPTAEEWELYRSYGIWELPKSVAQERGESHWPILARTPPGTDCPCGGRGGDECPEMTRL